MIPGFTGEPGWAGASVVLLALNLDDDRPRAVVRASLGDDGRVQVDDPSYARRWAAEGIVGRGEMGRLFPDDGQAFLDELPYVYRGAYLRAVPEDEIFEGVA